MPQLLLLALPFGIMRNSMNHPNRKSTELKPVVLIGGSDSSGGAGIQVDSRFLASLGVPFKNIVTAVTAQNHGKFFHLQDMDEDTLRAQAEVIKKDSIVKIGMLGKSLRVLNEFLDNQTIILDPVLYSSSGSTLLEKSDLNFLKEHFFPKVKIITPNILEAEILWGNKIKTPEDVEKAAEYIKTLGPKNVLIKGGHLSLIGMSDFFLGEKRIE